ncbi:MAG: hypothetical protein Q7S60_03390 [bacterium]|nr:hypothetical protein [bacterium]
MPVKKISIFGKPREIAPLLLLLVGAMVLRIPSLFEPYWYGDEGIYLTLGEAARHGLTWYKDIHDNKPPLLYLLAAISGSVFWFRLILLFWHAATLVLFWDLANKLFDRNKRAIVLSAAIFTLLTTIPLLEGNIANAEIFMIGPTIAGFLLLFTQRLTTGRLFLAGLFFSLSTLFKVPAAFDMLTIVLFWATLAFFRWGEILTVVKNSLVLALGFITPILATFVYFGAKGALNPYINAVWLQNLNYVGRWSIPKITAGSLSFEAGLPFRGIILVLVLLIIFVFRKRFNKVALFASLWFSVSLFAATLSGRPYPHYLIEIIPPLALLLGLVSFGQERFRFLPLPLLFLLLSSLIFYKFYYYPTFSYYGNFLAYAAQQKTQEDYFLYFGEKVPRTYKLAQTITSKTAPNDRVFIWGTEPETYALSRRLPVGRYTTSYHIRDFGGEEETLNSLKRKLPKYIIVVKDEEQLAGLRSFLEENYIYLETIMGAEVWRAVGPNIAKALSL